MFRDRSFLPPPKYRAHFVFDERCVLGIAAFAFLVLPLASEQRDLVHEWEDLAQREAPHNAAAPEWWLRDSVVVAHASIRVGTVAFPWPWRRQGRRLHANGIVATILGLAWHLFAPPCEVRDLSAGTDVWHDFVQRCEALEGVLRVKDASFVNVAQVVFDVLTGKRRAAEQHREVEQFARVELLEVFPHHHGALHEQA